MEKDIQKENPETPEILEAEIEPQSALVLRGQQMGPMTQLERLDTIIKLAERGEKYIAAINKIRQDVLAITNESDWVDQNGVPYLEHSGCQKIRWLYGINWKILEKAQVPLEDGHYRFDVKMSFYNETNYIEVIGSRSSNDPFFTTYYEYEGNAKVKKTRLGREVDSGNVMKAAISNAMQGILAFVGMKKMTWEDLKAGGLNVEKIKKEKGVKYDGKKDKKEPEQKTPEQKPPTETETAGPGPGEGANVRKEKPKNRLTKNQANALNNILSASKDETLPQVTTKLFNVTVNYVDFLSFDEAGAIIKYFSEKWSSNKNGGKK